MKELIKDLNKLEEIKKAAEEDLKNAPQGSLRISKNSNTTQFYWRTDPKDTKGKYIRKNEKELIRRLAQKDYAKKIISVLEPIINAKKKELCQLKSSSVQEQMIAVYENFSPVRQKLITPYIHNEDEFIRKWEYEKKTSIEKMRQSGNFPKEDLEIVTEKGEHVRSKSEKILADKLYMMDIPYLYEVPLYLQGYGYIKPDFTVLNKRKQKEYYWEHLGLMDDKNYSEKAIRKIENFEKNGIFPGKNLILTYETSQHPLNIKIVERLAKEYLM